MSLVATAVKNHMLSSPSLFPNRLSVLTFVFLNAGGGYHWNAKGELGCIYGLPENVPSMAMEDLDKILAQTRAGTGAVSMHEANLELQRLQRAHREKYIDLYAEECVQATGLTFEDIPMLSTVYDLDGTLMSSKGLPENLNKEWAVALGEVAQVCLTILRKAKKEGTLPAPMVGLEAEFAATMDALEPITHAQANSANAARRLKEIWDNLKMDDALGGPT